MVNGYSPFKSSKEKPEKSRKHQLGDESEMKLITYKHNWKYPS